MLPGETIASMQKASFHKCEDCGVELIPKILRSAAGHYIGTACNCGPYSRESGYYRSLDEAEIALKEGSFGRT